MSSNVFSFVEKLMLSYFCKSIVTWMFFGEERSNVFFFTFVSLAILFLT